MAKHKYIETPEKLYEIFEEYKEYTKNNPRKKLIKGNKDYVVHNEELEVPLTMAGFEVFCYKNHSTVDHYFRNEDGSYDEYRPICNIIKKEIRQDQVEGGMAQIYNASITQRLNGLTEKQETKQEGTINVKFGDIDE